METANEKVMETAIVLEKQTYNYKKTPQEWVLALRKSEVQVPEEKDLALLKISNPLLLAMAIHWEEDAVTFAYDIPAETISFSTLKEQSKADKLRAMANMGKIADLLELPFTFFIHPENILFDYNLLPKIAYRGLEGKMPPKETNAAVLLRQYKCLIISLFEEKADFTTLYEGQLEIKKGSTFIQTILKAESFTEIQAYLLENYNQTVATTKETTRQVAKSKFLLMKQLSIWMPIVVAILIVPLVYLLFFQMPFKDRMQEADTAFLKNDYEAVITKLEPVKTGSLPFTQKYSLAYSFVQGKQLNDQQKKVILNNITLRSNEAYLDYWIENGRGNLDEALDIAKKLEESDLIIYGITEKIEQVRNDTKLSGTKREEQIDALEKDYQKYDEKRKESLGTVDSAEANKKETVKENGTADTTPASQEEAK